MTTELYDQALKLQKMFPNWKFTSIVRKLSQSQFLPDSFENLVQSKIRKKRKCMDNNQNMRKKICTVQNNLNAVDLTSSIDNGVIVVSSSDESENSDSESSIILDDSINIDLIKENLLSIFPECAPLYLEFLITLAKDSIHNENLLVDHIVSRLINENYPKANNESTSTIPDLVLSVQESHNILPQVNLDITQLADNQTYCNVVPDLVTVKNEPKNSDLLNGRIQEVENSIVNIENKTETLNQNPLNLSIKNENTFNEFENESNHNDLHELLNGEIELFENIMNDNLDEFMKVYSELDKLSNNFLREEDLPNTKVTEIKSTGQEIKTNSEHIQINKPNSENIKHSNQIGKSKKMENSKNNDTNVEKLVLKLLPIFPDACPQFLRNFCKGRNNNPTELEEIIMHLIQNDFPKRNAVISQNLMEQETVNEEEQYQIMLELLPDADPDYLRVHCSDLCDKPDRLKLFIDDALERRDYPTLKDYKRKQQLSAQMKQYTTEFDVNKFLELIPNPDAHFNDPKRVCSYNDNTRFNYKTLAIDSHMKDVFKNLFPSTRVCDIYYEIKSPSNEKRVILIYNSLKKGKYPSMKRPRKPTVLQQFAGFIDVPYIQEIAYITHYDTIQNVLKQREQDQKTAFEMAKANGQLLECQCCFDDEVMEQDTFTCDFGHQFCKACITRSIEISFGENKLQFTCLTNCKAEFSLAVLQKILKPNLFSKIALRKQIEEVKSAGIEELESCPFCDFATIPPLGDKVFKCLNDECLKESCRQCKELSHIPYRCDEIEKSDEVKARTYIEDKMTEALLRKCWKCGMKFIKEDGCNKMTCQCGAMMCYVCGKPVENYQHFNGQGGTMYHLCPLYSDTEKLHLDAVRKTGEEAKHEIKQKNPSVKLKFDPLTGLPESKKKDSVYKPGPHYNPLQDQQIVQNFHYGIPLNLHREVPIQHANRRVPFQIAHRGRPIQMHHNHNINNNPNNNLNNNPNNNVIPINREYLHLNYPERIGQGMFEYLENRRQPY